MSNFEAGLNENGPWAHIFSILSAQLLKLVDKNRRCGLVGGGDPWRVSFVFTKSHVRPSLGLPSSHPLPLLSPTCR